MSIVNESVTVVGSQFRSTGQASISAIAASSTSVALPGIGPTALVTNLGPAQIFIKLGDSTVAATVSDQPLMNGQQAVMAATGYTYVAAIAQNAGDTATVAVTSGYGRP